MTEQWNALWNSSASATTFNSATWQQLAVGATLRPHALRLITVTRREQLLAVLPMELVPSGFLESTGLAVSDYLDPLAADDPAVWSAVLQLLNHLWDHPLKAVTFHNVRGESPIRSILPSIAQSAGLVVEQAPLDAAARIQLPATWDEYLASLDAHERKELRRKIRKAGENAGASLFICDDRNFAPEHLTAALDLIEAADESKRDWFRSNVRPLLERTGEQLIRERRLRLLMLNLNREGEAPAEPRLAGRLALPNSRPAAAILDFPSRSGPLLYNSGFDPAHREFSPGVVTFGLAIKDAIERKCPIFDMLRGQHPYKYKLGATDYPLYRLSLHPKNG
jgi:CelD/BcsL family acetyltransferase involved in cellulose biosynthesis